MMNVVGTLLPVLLLLRCGPAEALTKFTDMAAPSVPHTVWSGSGTSPRDVAQYFLFPPSCPTAADQCCPNSCGASSGRGSCVDVQLDSTVCDLESIDALGWFWTHFNFTCRCNGNYGGPDCMSCNYGYSGADCSTQLTPVVRKEFSTLTAAEQKQVIQGFTLLKNSYYGPYSSTQTFLNHHAAYHLWATVPPYNEDLPNLSYAHGGQAFPLWHRRFLRDLEVAMQNALNNPSFALPYWDWTKTNKNIAQYGLSKGTTMDAMLTAFGGTGTNNGWCRTRFYEEYYMCPCPLQTGTFANWAVFDPAQAVTGYNQFWPTTLARGFGCMPPNTPSVKNVEYAFSQAEYTRPPYDSSEVFSFEAALEGNHPASGQALADGVTNHDSVHDWSGGGMAFLETAANDPLFFMHHAFIDKMFETWIRQYGASTGLSQMASTDTGAPIGHGRDECAGPFYPLIKHSYWFADSRTLGYDFDSVSTTAPKEDSPDAAVTSAAPTSQGARGIADVRPEVAVFYASMGLIVGTLLALAVYCVYRRRNMLGKALASPKSAVAMAVPPPVVSSRATGAAPATSPASGTNSLSDVAIQP